MIKRTSSWLLRAGVGAMAALLLLGTAACGGPKTPSDSGGESGATTLQSGPSAAATTAASDVTAATTTVTEGDGKGTTAAAGLRTTKPTAATTKGSGPTKAPTPVPVTPSYDFLANFPENQRGKTIQFLYWGAPTSTLKKQAEDFKAKTGVTVKFVQTTWDLYTSKLMTSVNSGAGYEVAVLTQDWWPSAIIKNLFSDISVGHFDLDKDPAYDLEAMKICSWNGKYYGVALKNSPSSTTMNVLLYNKTKFKKAGLTTPFELWKQGQWNWTTYMKAAKKLTSNDGKFFGTATIAETYMLSANTDFVKFETKNGKTAIKNNLKDPALEKAWKFYVDSRDKDKVEPKSAEIADFYSGKIAMLDVIDARDSKALNIAELKKSMKDEVGVAPFPCPEGQTAVAPAKILVWGTARTARYPVAASYFIRYFLDTGTLSESDLYVNDEAKEVYAAYANMTKSALLSRGVVGYSTMGDFWALYSAVAHGESDQVSVNLQTYSSKLDASIQAINKAMEIYS